MKKRILFTVCLVIVLLGLSLLWGHHLYLSDSRTVVHGGLFEVPSLEEEPDLDVSLSGEWEYYPGTLLVSGSGVRTLPGEVLNGQRRHQLYGEEPLSDYHSSTEPNTNAQYQNLPDLNGRSIGLFQDQPSCASYRIVLKNCYEFYTGDPLFLCLCGNVSGNYRIYINGKLRGTRMSSPWGYPNYLLDRGVTDNEVIIEVSNASGPLNTTPRLMTVATAMTYYDYLKNITMVISSVLIAIFIILLFTIISSKKPDMLPYFLFGLISTLFFICSVVWGSGFLDSMTFLFPNVLLYVFPKLLSTFALGILFFTIYRILPHRFGKRPLLLCWGIAAISILLQLGQLLPVFPSALLAIGELLSLGLLLFWIICMYRWLPEFNDDQRLLYSGCLISGGGMIALLIIGGTGLSEWTYLLMPLCIIYYASIVFVVLWRRQQRQLKRTEELLALEKEAVKMQTAMYSSQINPHFLYNTLMTIQEMCYSDPKEAARLIVQFSKYLRTNIDFMESRDLITFRNELAHIDTFIYVQKARFGDKLKFIKEIGIEDFLLPPLSVQPIVENAIKYGVRASEDGGTVSLHTFEDKDWIHIVVENDGPGFSPEDAISLHSLNNIQKRLESLVSGTLNIESNGPQTNGVKVEIRIPLSAQDSEADKTAAWQHASAIPYESKGLNI